MKLLSIVQKNFRIFTRSRISALIIFLGPLLLVSLIGMSFSNTQLPGLSVGVFSPNYNDFTDSIITKIKDSKFEVVKFESRELCSDSVKKSQSAICLVFPENMDRENNEVTFIVDYSKINLVFIVVDIFSTRVSERATELRATYAADLLEKVVQTKDDLKKQQDDLTSLSSKQASSKEVLGSASSGLNEMTTTTDFGVAVTAKDASTSIIEITSKINTAKSKIADSRSAVSTSALSATEKDDINAKLDSANSALAVALTYIEGNASTQSLEYIINQIDSALTNAKMQLEAVNKKKEAVKGDLITLEGSISESISAISSIKSSVDAMASRISSVEKSDAEHLVSPIKTKIEPVTTPETHFNYLFPTLIVLIVMITAILLSSTLVMNEKKSKSMFRNFITPTSEFIFDLGTFVTALLAIVMQLFVFLLISSVFFETNILSSFGPSLLILILVTSVFILLGMMIGFIFKSEETYVLAAITVSALLLFLSSTVMPIESISDSVRAFASFTPFVVSENILRQAMFFDFSFASLLPGLLILAGYIAVFGAAVYFIEKLAKFKLTLKKKEVKK